MSNEVIAGRMREHGRMLQRNLPKLMANWAAKRYDASVASTSATSAPKTA